MGYTPPTLEELKRLPLELEAHYHTGNPERLKLIAFTKFLVADDKLLKHALAVDILMGGDLFILELVLAEYKTLSPEGGLFNKGSNFYKVMKALLKMNLGNNQMSQQEYLVYVTHFYRYMKTMMPDNFPENFFWEPKEVMDEAKRKILIKEVMEQQFIARSKAVLTRQNDAINLILKAPPTPAQLKFHQKNIEAKYIEKSKIRNANSVWKYDMSYLPQAKLIDVLIDFIEKNLESSGAKDCMSSLDLKKEDSLEHMLRYAIYLYMMILIEMDYKDSWLSSPNSDELYMICCGNEGLNLAHSSQLGVMERLAHIALLHNFVSRMVNVHKDFVAVKEKGGFKELTELLNRVLQHSARMLGDIHEEKNEKSRVKSTLRTAGKGMTRYAGNSLIRNLFGIGLPAPLAAAIDVASGVVIGTVFAVFGLQAGTAVYLGHVVRTTVLPLATSSVVDGAFGTMGAAIGDVATEIVVLPIRLTTGMLSALARIRADGQPADIYTLREDIKWITALQSLPPEVFPESSKETVEKTTGVTRMLN